MAEILQDFFCVTAIDADGKKFDKVSRIEAKSEQFDMSLMLDINVDVYPMSRNDKFTLVLASTLRLDGTPDDGTFDQSRKKSLADQYEYVMYGKLYKYEEDSGRVAVYVSFGGLLMLLKGDRQHLDKLQLDQRLYLLIRKN